MEQSINISQICDDLVYVEEFDAVSINIKSAVSALKYPAKQHAQSVARHLGVNEGLIYLPGRPQRLIEDSDQPKTFRQRRYFYYLSGVDFADCVVTYDIANDSLRLFIPSTDPRSVIWLGSTPSIQECEKKYDVDYVGVLSDINDYILGWLDRQHNPSIYALHKDQVPCTLILRSKNRTLANIRKFLDTTSLLPAMDAARVIKDDYEISLIRKANEISAYAHRGVLEIVALSDNEAQLEATFAGRCIARQAKKQAYDIIAGSGQNASTLHYSANNEPLEGRQLVCLDAGCEWNCYASDVTRTFPISGTYSEEATEIYAIVKEMQETCIDAIRPGLVFGTLQSKATEIAVKGLMKLGILHNGTFEELLPIGAIFFPHGLGHHVGLEVHDVSASRQRLLENVETIHDIRNCRYFSHPELAEQFSDSPSTPGSYETSQRLAPNMVITVEPGIYFSKFALEEVYLKQEKYSKYINRDLLMRYYPVGGIRIEDDILVTKDGYENLTTAPKGEDACKIIREHKKATDSTKGRIWRLW